MSMGGFEAGLCRHGRELGQRSVPTIDRGRGLYVTIAVPWQIVAIELRMHGGPDPCWRCAFSAPTS
jgi:hypothetical protein